MSYDIRKRFLVGMALLAVIYIAGIVGYMVLGGPGTSFLDALYMTTITLTTVGYGEVVKIEGTGRIFTIALQICGVGTLFYMFSTTTAFIVEGELSKLLGRRRMDKKIAKMKGHYIVCGGGEIARNILTELSLTGRGVVFIENDPERIEHLMKSHSVPYVQGDATSEECLQSARIDTCAGIIFALPEDRDNILGVITARSMNPSVRIVVKGVDARIKDKMLKAGADSMVSPNFIGAMRLVSEMIRPHAVSFIDDMLRLKGKAIRLEEVVLGEESTIIGSTINSSNMQHETGFLIVAIREKGDGQFIPSPSPGREFKPGDVLIVMGDPTRLGELDKFAGGVAARHLTETTMTKIAK